MALDVKDAKMDVAQAAGVDVGDADAAVGDVKSPKTFYSVAAPRKTGTMATRTLSPNNDTVLAGYYAATTLSTVDVHLAPANIKPGVTIFGKVGTYVRDAILGNGKTATGDYLSTQSLSYVEGGVIRLERDGNYRTKVELKTKYTEVAYGKIYKNGSPYGTEHSTTSKEYVLFSQDLAFNKLDLCQQYQRAAYQGVCQGRPYIYEGQVIYPTAL